VLVENKLPAEDAPKAGVLPAPNPAPVLAPKAGAVPVPKPAVLLAPNAGVVPVPKGEALLCWPKAKPVLA
jgi:hypothetical protein